MLLVLKYACFVEYIAVFMLFCWGLQHYFRPPPGPAPLRLQLLKVVGLAGAIFQVWEMWRTAHESIVAFCVSLVLLTMTACLFQAARRAHRAEPPALAFVDILPPRLVVSGKEKSATGPPLRRTRRDL